MKKVLSYNDIYEFDIKLMKMVIKEFMDKRQEFMSNTLK